MKKTAGITAICLTALALTAPAQASTVWATGVDWTKGDGNIAANRSDPNAALNAPDGPGIGSFLSLGLSDYAGDDNSYTIGFADFTFGQSFTGNTVGGVFEITWGNRLGYPEYARVFVGSNGVFSAVGDIVNSLGSALTFQTNLAFDTVRVLDTTRFVTGSQSPRSTDGFDIDAVGIISSTPQPGPSPVPVPPALGALVAALGGLGLLKARRRRA